MLSAFLHNRVSRVTLGIVTATSVGGLTVVRSVRTAPTAIAPPGIDELHRLVRVLVQRHDPSPALLDDVGTA